MARVAADDVDRIVAQWARERPELETEAMAAFGRIYRIAQLVGDRQEQAYRRFGIGRGEFDLLATLRRAGPPFLLSPGQLGRSLMITSGGITGRLDRLEQRGLIARSPDPSDRRALVISLTEQGRQVVDAAVEAGLAEQRAAFERLAPRDRARLNELLRELLAASASE